MMSDDVETSFCSQSKQTTNNVFKKLIKYETYAANFKLNGCNRKSLN